MSTERIDHVAEARRLIDAVKEAVESIEGEFYAPEQLGVINAALDRNVSVAAVEAQLAMVEQTRIQNLILIAQGGHGAAMGIEGFGIQTLSETTLNNGGPWASHTTTLRPDIAAALGIGDGDE